MKMPIDYKNFKINKIGDIDDLYEVVETHGGFTLTDYKALLGKIKNTSQPVRIKKRLEKYIKPLACDYIETKISDKSNCDIAGIDEAILSNINPSMQQVNYDDPFNKSYKASDFKLKDGYVELGKLRLTSKRIQQASRKLLLNIDHTFKIGKITEEKMNSILYPILICHFFLNQLKIIGVNIIILKKDQKEMPNKSI